MPSLDDRFGADTHLHPPREWGDLRVEHRRIDPGSLKPASMQCVVATVALAGRAPFEREANGVLRRGFIEQGMASIDPIGLQETVSQIKAPVEFLHMDLAPAAFDLSAEADFDLDPAKTRLAFAGGIRDPLLVQIALALRAIVSRPEEVTDRLFVDGARSMLVAHLLSKYGYDRWQRHGAEPDLDPRRLARVMNYIESHFAEPLALAELAEQACLSEYHFCRLFKKATGLSPHRYVTERRIRDAQVRLARGRASMSEVALEAGFGSQGNFNRLFRRHTGMTPRQFRTEQRD